MSSCWVHRDGGQPEATYTVAVDGPGFHKEHGLCDMHGRALIQGQPDHQALRRDADPARVRQIIAAGRDPGLTVTVKQRATVRDILPLVDQAKLEAVVEQAWQRLHQPDAPGPHDRAGGDDQPGRHDRAEPARHPRDAYEPPVKADAYPLIWDDRMSGEQRAELVIKLTKAVGLVHGVPDFAEQAGEVADGLDSSVPGVASVMPAVDYTRIRLEAMREQARLRAAARRYPAQRPAPDAGRDRA